jgi:hypothetical protein
VLIYSHGEDDLDQALILFRRRLGLRVYLNHCLNLLKAGGVLLPDWEEQSWARKTVRRWLITDCDMLLAASPREALNFERSYPQHAAKIRLGGGAHLDEWITTQTKEPVRRIYYFPTFRESAEARARLFETIRALSRNPTLKSWLVQNDYEFWIGAHINSQPVSRPRLEPPFVAASLGSLVEDLRESAIFVSDYSGLTFDFLILGRPQILFPFDWDDYRQRRRLYQEYAEMDFAPQAKSVDELVNIIVHGGYSAPTIRAAATRWRTECLPPQPAQTSDGAISFAAESLRRIDARLAESQRL